MKTSLQTKLFVWNSPSIFVSTIHQTVQKRSSKRDISLNNRKKKRFERFEHETVSKKKRRLGRNMILTQSRRRTNESFLFLYHFVSRICIIDGVKVTSVLSNRSTIYQSIRALHSDHAPSTICFPVSRFAHEFPSYCCRFARSRSYTRPF